jgi:hypothetical protein
MGGRAGWVGGWVAYGCVNVLVCGCVGVSGWMGGWISVWLGEQVGGWVSWASGWLGDIYEQWPNELLVITKSSIRCIVSRHSRSRGLLGDLWTMAK